MAFSMEYSFHVWAFDFFARFTGHKNHDYKIDSALNCEDTHVISGSEDGFVYYWDLVEVQPMSGYL